MCACSAGYWLTRDDGQKESLREEAADRINDVLSGTPLAGIGNALRQAPPPPPPQVLTPATAPGTLSGRTVSGTIASAPDFSQPGADESKNGEDSSRAGDPGSQPMFSMEPVPPATEDSTVRADYLAEIATWLASRYRPGADGGTLAMNMQSLNNLGGVTIAGQTKGGRAGLLRYAFQPSMIQGLYHLYIDRFMSDLNMAAQKRGLDEAQNRQFHLALGGRASMLATALEGISRVQDLGGRLAQINKLAQNTVEINEQLAQAVFELDELRDTKAQAKLVSTAQMRVDGITARYRRAVDEHENARRALVEDIRKQSGQSLDGDSLLFLAGWTERRLAGDPAAMGTIKTCAGILRDLARRCAQSGAAR